jgi:branched-chain amino acid transport system substrate-binding protein
MAQTPAAPAASIKLAVIEAFSGAFANTGDAVFRNLVWGVERVNDSGGVALSQAQGGGQRLLQLQRYDNKGQVEEALVQLKAAIDDGAHIILQGNSSAVALALIDAINKHNEREPQRRVLFLNYSAVDPILTNEKCSFWHFRFDAHADMRMTALMQALRPDMSVKRIYLIGQDYSFGQAVLREAKRQLEEARPDIAIVGNELHPVGRVKDFAPYMAKIKASGADAVMTGNWGNDLTLLVKAAKEAGYNGKFYTFYGNALGAPAAIGEAGIGKVVAVADWMPNVGSLATLPAAERKASDAFYQAFKKRFAKPEEDYVHLRMQLMVQALAQALRAQAVAGQLGSKGLDVVGLARHLEVANVSLGGQTGYVRAVDHQFQQPLVVGVMARSGTEGVPFDVEGSGYGFKVVYRASAQQAQMPTTCKMSRPS